MGTMTMVGIELLSDFRAVTTVGVVLGEAIVLYAGYGVVLQSFGSEMLEALTGE